MNLSPLTTATDARAQAQSAALAVCLAIAESSRDPRSRILARLALLPNQTADLDFICEWFGGKNPERTWGYVVELRSCGAVNTSTAGTGNQFVCLADPSRVPRIRPITEFEAPPITFPDDLALSGRSPTSGEVSPHTRGDPPTSAVKVPPPVGEVRTHAVHLENEILKSHLPSETHGGGISPTTGGIVDFLERTTPRESWEQWGGWWRVVARNNPERIERAYRKLMLAGKVQHPARFMRARIMEMSEGL